MIGNENSSCLAFGYFDGMHNGHEAIIRKVAELSAERSLLSKVVTFYDESKTVLTTEKEKSYLIEKTGVKRIVSMRDLEDFDLKKFILSQNAKIVVVGKNFKFHQFDLDLLRTALAELAVELVVCDIEKYDGEEISSSMLEKALDDEDYEKYTMMCGHPYIMIGVIEHGKALGRTVGMPTANLGVSAAKKMPISGVYSTISRFGNEKYMGLTNIGKRPSVDNDDRVTIETHILDFAKDVYGEESVLEVRFFIRGVIKFSSLKEVQEQVQKDLAKSREKLAELM